MESKLELLDYLVFAAVLAISVAIGIYYRCTGGKQSTTNEYLLADKDMSVIPVAFSLMASFMSAITLLGVAKENYVFGTQFVVINISYIIGTPIAAYVFLPVFYKMQSTSSYEYLDQRFGKVARYCGLMTFMVQMILYMAVVLYAPALTISAVTGLAKWPAIITTGIVCTFYSSLGGMKAVLWTDLVQSLLMFASLLLVVVTGTINAGGISEVWNIAKNGSRIEFFNFDPDPTTRHTVWTLAIGGIFVYTSIYGINQAQIQRLLTVRSLKKAQLALFLNWPIVSALSIITSFGGLVVYAKYHGCDPISTRKVKLADQILPYYVLDTVGHLHGLTGLFIAGIFSGALSTVSSALNSLAAVTLTDIVKPNLKKQLSEEYITTITKLISVGYGILCIALTGVAQLLGGILQASLSIFSILGGPLMGLYFLGMCSSRANQKGAVIGLLFGLLLSFWISFGAKSAGVKSPALPRHTYDCPTAKVPINGTENMNISLLLSTMSSSLLQNITHQSDTKVTNDQDKNNSSASVLFIYKLSYMWYSALGFFSVVIVGLIISLITGGCEDVDPDLLSPVYKKLFCYKKTNSDPHLEMVDLKETDEGTCT